MMYETGLELSSIEIEIKRAVASVNLHDRIDLAHEPEAGVEADRS